MLKNKKFKIYRKFLEKNLNSTSNKLILAQEAIENNKFKIGDYLIAPMDSMQDFKNGEIIIKIKDISSYGFSTDYFSYFSLSDNSNLKEFVPYFLQNGLISSSAQIRRAYPLEIKLFKFIMKNYKPIRY